MQSLYLVDNWISKLAFRCAYSEQEKRLAYQLRFNEAKANFPNVAYMEQVIDQFDRDSTHLLIKDETTDKYVATIRVSSPLHLSSSHANLPCQKGNAGSKSFILQFLESGSPLSVSEISGLSVDRQAIEYPAERDIIREVAYLAAFSLARLRFDDRVLLSLPYKEFKRLRSRGLLLEHTSAQVVTEGEDLFWLSSESGIQAGSPIYDTYQHILAYLAQQTNQVKVESNRPALRKNL